MSRILRDVAICLAAGWLTATGAAAAEITEAGLRALAVGTATADQVVTQFGPPARREANDEGLSAIVYLGAGARIDPESIFVFAGAVDGVFIPGARSEGATSAGLVTALIFDRNGLLMYWRAILGGPPITSGDGAAEMPNVKLTLDDGQKQTALPPDDGEPHLGIQPVPVADLDPAHRAAFAAAGFDGLVVANVIPGSVAAKAGMVEGDYLYAINGALVKSGADALRAMKGVKRGDAILARAKRIDQQTHRVKEAVFVLKF